MHPATLVLLTALVTSPVLWAQQPAPGMRTTQLADHLYMLEGRGGNLAFAIGDEGVLLIDDQFAPMLPQIKAAIAKQTDGEIRFVINTHWHGDHVGGNEALARGGAVILAHENVRRRMSTEQFMKPMNRRIPAAPKAALPVVTIAESATMHWSGEEVELLHVAHAHTDGDVIVHFTNANVIHMGDVFFHGMYPFLDVSSGGSLPGLIAAVERVLQRCDDDTRIIPGHGPLTDKAGLAGYRAMLRKVRDRVTDLVFKGHTADEVIAAQPTKEWDATLGRGFINPGRFARTIYGEVVKALGMDDAERAPVLLKGSDLLLEVAQGWAKAAGKAGEELQRVTVTGGGTSGGISALIAGKVDLAFCSRRPRERELAATQQQEIMVRSVEIAREALAVVVHADNPLESLSKAQLAGIFGAGGELVEWSQLDVQLQTGGDGAIATHSPQPNSGTYAPFRQTVLGRGGRYRSDTLCLAGSRDLVTAVAKTKNAIGYVPAAYAKDATGVRVIPIADTGNVSAPPTPPRMPGHADYPITRSYYLLMRTDASARARAMLDWIRSSAGQEVTRAAGYEPIGLDR